jgi:hypothetical protein
MIGKKTVVIITDESEETVKMAVGIAAALKGNKVSVKGVSEFSGNDILPADVFFLGCKTPSPDSFAYIEDLFKHINLAGRPCGVFSPGNKATVKYLAGVVHDSEAALNPEPLVSLAANEIKDWSKSVISKAF